MEKKIKKTMALLDDYMKKYSYNQKDVAEKLGVNESTVCRWFKGQGITWKHLNAIQFLTTGHLENNVCAITGLPQCPFVDADGITKDLINDISKMSRSEKLDLLSYIDRKKNEVATSAG